MAKTFNQKEFGEQIKTLNKCVSENQPADNIISILKVLQENAAPSEDWIRKSSAGMIVGKLRNNSNKDVARHAMALVKAWRKLVEREKALRAAKAKGATPTTSTTSSATTTTTTATTATSSSPKPAASTPSSSQTQPYQGDPEKRRFDKDKADIKRTSSDTRNNCIGIMYNGLAYRSKESVAAVTARAVEVEEAAFAHFGGETDEYKKKIRSLLQNLKNKMNKELAPRVLSGELPAATLITLSDAELLSSEQRKMEEALAKENMKRAQIPKEIKSISTAWRCGKCGQMKVSYTQAQTRSADEPMTTFCECQHCGNRWKFS